MGIPAGDSECRQAVLHRPFLARQAREAQVFAAQGLGGVDDLAGMEGEVFRDVEDGFEAGDSKPLDRIMAHKVLSRKPGEHSDGSLNRLAKMGQDWRNLQRPLLGEFLVAPPVVGSTAESRDDPLTNVSFQVQHKVPNAIRGRIRA